MTGACYQSWLHSTAGSAGQWPVQRSLNLFSVIEVRSAQGAVVHVASEQQTRIVDSGTVNIY